jgi:hypothetical protein
LDLSFDLFPCQAVKVFFCFLILLLLDLFDQSLETIIPDDVLLGFNFHHTERALVLTIHLLGNAFFTEGVTTLRDAWVLHFAHADWAVESIQD